MPNADTGSLFVISIDLMFDGLGNKVVNSSLLLSLDFCEWCLLRPFLKFSTRINSLICRKSLLK